MRRAHAWLARWTGLLGRRKQERELAAELETHLALHIEDNLRSGMAPEEARRQALIKLGGMEQAKELYRERHGIPLVDSLWQDLRYGARMLRKSPGFTLAAVLTLALGIGANTAIFSVVNAALLRALPYKDASRLVLLQETNPRVGDVAVSYPDFLDWRAQSHSFTAMAAVENEDFDLAGTGRAQVVSGYVVSPTFLSLLGVAPVLGRDFSPREEKPGTAPVVLISDSLWQSRFGGSGGALGKALQLDDKVYTIIGVLPPNFRFLDRTDLLLPIGVFAGGADMNDRGQRGDTRVLARLAPGVTSADALTEIRGIAARLAAAYPRTNTGMGASLETMREALVGSVRPAMLVVFGAALLVLLIACVNVAGLYLVRGAARTQEIAVRAAFGASRGRIVRQMLTESLLLAALGGLAGLLLAAVGVSELSRLAGPDPITGMSFQIDRGAFLFLGLLVILVAVAFGLVPALQASRFDIQGTLKEGGRGGSASAKQHRLRNAFAVAQMALALTLLVGAGLMVKSLYRLMRVNPGFQPARVLDVEMNLDTWNRTRSTPAAQLEFWRDVVARVRPLPGVQNAAVGTGVPFTGDHSRADITLEGLPTPQPGEFPHPDIHIVSPGYFATMGIPIERGRAFRESDNAQGALVALVNQTLARRFWPDGEAVGKRFVFGHPGPKNQWFTIVGVAGDTRLYGLDQPARFEVYVPLAQWPRDDMHLEVRSAADPAALASAIRAAVASVDPDVPLYGVQTLKSAVDESVSTRRLTLVLLGSFSLLALVLAAVGIYGVISYATAQRAHEIGIRMTLGATPQSMVRLLLRQGARLAALGVVAGLVGAAGLARLLGSLLYGVGASDPETFAAAAVVLGLVALAACWLPARRVTEVDPVIVLRQE